MHDTHEQPSGWYSDVDGALQYNPLQDSGALDVEQQTSDVGQDEAEISVVVNGSSFTLGQWQEMSQLHRRYQDSADFMNAQELARLRFLRWLFTTNQMQR